MALPIYNACELTNRRRIMSSKSGGGNSGGVGICGLLAVLFIGLKLTDNIDWSWWWVLSPMWIPLLLALALVALVASFK